MQQIQQLNDQLEAKNKEIDEIRAELAAKNNENNEIRAELAAKNNENNEIKTELAAEKNQNDELLLLLMGKLEAKEKENQVMKEKFKDIEKILKDKNDDDSREILRLLGLKYKE